MVFALLAAGCSSVPHRSAGRAGAAGSGTPGLGGLPAGVSTGTTIPPQMLPAGQVGQRSDVPWSIVGPGWLLAEWAPYAPSPAVVLGRPSGTVLFLVDPLGGRYALASGTSVPDSDLVAWSGDAKRALFETRTAGVANVALTVLDLTSGTATHFATPAGHAPEFTEPNGLAVLIGAGFVNNGTPTGTVSGAQRLDLSGSPQFAFPNSFPQTGSILGGIGSPDGTRLAFDATTGAGIVLVSNDGRLLENLSIPAQGLCSTVRWWSNDQVLVQCGPSAGPSLWLVPTDGRAPNQLVPGNDAWQLLSGVYSTTGRCHMGTCNFGLLKVQPDGSSAPLPVPTEWSSNLDIGALGAFEDRLAVFAPPSSVSGFGNQAGGILEWFAPDTGTVVPLLGGSVNAGSVNAALMHEPSIPSDAPTSSPPPHFDTPEAAMTYLASAWNRNDAVALDHVTDPAARSALQAMHDQAVNLRLNHCTPRPQGDYLCYFDHDYPAGTSTTLAGGNGHAVFLVGPAGTPGWYMTVFQGCG